MKKVLVIEDNPDVRENICEVLELACYEVLPASDGYEGVKLAKESTPDLILCDIMMPGLDGYGVLYMLSKNPETANIPFVYLSAKADKSDVRKGMNLGADDYLTKPFEEMELLNAVETRIKKHEQFTLRGDGVEALENLVHDVKGKEALKELKDGTTHKTYKAKEDVYREGDSSNSLFFIYKGKVKLWRISETGKELITTLAAPGDYFGYTSIIEGEPYPDTATALEETEIAIIPRNQFLDLMQQHRDISNLFIKLLSNNLAEKEVRLLKLAYSSVRERVADAIKNFLSKQDHNIISVARDDLAHLAGTATETLIRVLSDFKEEGIIEINGREIRVLKPERFDNIYRFV